MKVQKQIKTKFLPVILIAILLSLVLLLFKTESTELKFEKYSCSEDVPNPRYADSEYNKEKIKYVESCVQRDKETNPNKYMGLSNNLTELTTTWDCEKEFNNQYKGYKEPEHITRTKECTRGYKMKCIAFFGKCIFDVGSAN